MGTLWKTCYELSEGHRRAYLAQLLVQVVQIFFQVFMTFLTKVVIDAIQGAEELAKANFLEDWVVWLITGGSGNEYLLEHRLAILPTALVVTAVVLGLVNFLRMWLRSYAIAYVNGCPPTLHDRRRLELQLLLLDGAPLGRGPPFPFLEDDARHAGAPPLHDPL